MYIDVIEQQHDVIVCRDDVIEQQHDVIVCRDDVIEQQHEVIVCRDGCAGTYTYMRGRRGDI